jgi:hypothetical protein
MRKLIGLGAVLGSVFAVWACSSSSPAPANNNDNDSGGSSSGGSSSGGSSGGSGDAAPSCSQSQISSLLAAEGYSIDGGLDASSIDGGATGACVQSMCKSDIDACMTEDCTTCEQAIIGCALSKCVAALPTFDSGPPPDGCVSPPDCVALAACCTPIASGAQLFPQLATLATTCTTNAASCSQSECKSTIMAVQAINPALCALPDGG